MTIQTCKYRKHLTPTPRPSLHRPNPSAGEGDATPIFPGRDGARRGPPSIKIPSSEAVETTHFHGTKINIAKEKK